MTFNVYLSFDGNCEEAFNFYSQVFKAPIGAMISHEGTPAEAHVPAEWKKKIMHARLDTPNGVLMGGDAPMGQYKPLTGFSVNLAFKGDEHSEAERIYKQLSDGGKVQMPLQQTFWAKGFAMFYDRYGVPWMINCE